MENAPVETPTIRPGMQAGLQPVSGQVRLSVLPEYSISLYAFHDGSQQHSLLT